jgi:hypothetical protein
VVSVVGEVEAALSERGIAHLIESELRQLNYAPVELRRFYGREAQNRLKPMDAYVFASFVERQIEDIQRSLQEIDAEYA